MLVDDNEIDIFINQKVIEFNDFASNVINIQSAGQAIELLKKAGPDEIPEVIFLDLNMPVVDGFKFLYEFSKMADTIREKARIVVLTSSDNSRDKDKIAANTDVLDYVSKPLTDSKLNDIRRLLEH